MALDVLTSEHWRDIREAIQRRLKEISESKVESRPARSEQARKINSLKESLDRIEELIRDLHDEENELPFK